MLINLLSRRFPVEIRRFWSTIPSKHLQESWAPPKYLQLSPKLQESENVETARLLVNSMHVFEDFLTQSEEQSLFDEVEPYMTKLRYEFDHWDNAIHGYRETERLKWNEQNTVILDRLRAKAFPARVAQLKFVHILDLEKSGHIKPHVDAVRFCGDTIAGLSLLTDSIMRLVNEKNKDFSMDILLKRRSLYIMNGPARYDYTHEILAKEFSVFNGLKVEKNRRISIICRNEPRKTET